MPRHAVRSSVVLRQVPARAFLESQDHQHDLIRELQLIDLGSRFDLGTRQVSQHLAELIGNILSHYQPVRTATRAQALEAVSRGDEFVDLQVPIMPGMADALRTWLDLLTQADEVCDRGRLLVLPASPEVRQLRADYVERLTALIES